MYTEFSNITLTTAYQYMYVYNISHSFFALRRCGIANAAIPSILLLLFIIQYRIYRIYINTFMNRLGRLRLFYRCLPNSMIFTNNLAIVFVWSFHTHTHRYRESRLPFLLLLSFFFDQKATIYISL